jgi:hypothetical protein
MAARERITLLWPDGAITTGTSWSEVEDAVRAEQPSPYKTRREFRAEMRKRAALWSGSYPVAAIGTSRRFLLGLAKEGMFSVFTEPQPSTSSVPSTQEPAS